MKLPTLVTLSLAALLSACAGQPAAPSPAATATEAAARDCSRIDADIAAAQAARRDAELKKGEAWKAVVPFAVAGRYASANAAIRDAEQRLAGLRAEAQRQGCLQAA
ncbi:MAG: hypothetical protein KF788_14035 [Piscinibacter sp.]|nr:hypothetical protein [Piscinibacter sp.]